MLRNLSYLTMTFWYWQQMKEHFIILINLTWPHFWYYMLSCYFCIYVTVICNYFFRHVVNSKMEKKISSSRKRNDCVLSRCTCAKLNIFLSATKFLKWALILKDTWKTSQCKKYQKLWTMDYVKFAQGWELVLLIDPNGIHKNIMLEITSY